MPNQPLFSSKSFQKKLELYTIDEIAGISEKLATIKEYCSLLRSGRVAQSKETSMQADFLNLFFGNVLDYPYTGAHQWCLEKEYKSRVDGKVVDGALGFFSIQGGQLHGDVRAVVELKDYYTDLDRPQNREADKRTPVEQAFSYVPKMGGKCKWVIVSNFREIRLYHASNQGAYERFFIDELEGEREAKRFFFFLHKDRLIAQHEVSHIDSILLDVQEAQKQITGIFYDQYRQIRVAMLQYLLEKYPLHNKIALLLCVQKLLDRFIFLCFCKSTELVREAIVKDIRDISRRTFDLDENQLWKQLRGVFRSMDMGNERLHISAFNGGLFATDALLDEEISIDDAILESLFQLAEYDFNSELNVNVLGHIFEQSLSDVEFLKEALLQNKPIQALLTEEAKRAEKRKKHGVFYTPEYITGYMVRQTLGEWLLQQQIALGLMDLPDLMPNDYASIKVLKRKEKATGATVEVFEHNANIATHLAFWEAYMQVLRDVKVIDPACGSGAFLNQVFDFLYAENLKVEEEIALLKWGTYHRKEVPSQSGTLFQLSTPSATFEIDRHILHNNIFGVDISAESVEITQLSLWLKTAKKGKKLANLGNNIRCGNSLIADKAIAGPLAFDWQSAFPEIMEKGGFDIIIGNPPYIFAREKMSDDEKAYYNTHFETSEYQLNTYLLFIELAVKLLNTNGQMSYIVPNAWLMVSSAQRLRAYLLANMTLHEIVSLLGHSFADANVETVILHAQKAIAPADHSLRVKQNSNADFVLLYTKAQHDFVNNHGAAFNVFANEAATQLIQKLQETCTTLESVVDVKAGLKAYEVGAGTPPQTPENVKQRPYDFDRKIDADTYPYLEGQDVRRYGLLWSGGYLRYGNHLAAPRTFDLFSGEKIIMREITGKYPHCIYATYSSEIHLFNMSNIAILPKANAEAPLLYILALLNSRLLSYYFLKNTPKAHRKIFPKIILRDLKAFPIRLCSHERMNALGGKAQTLSSIYQKMMDKEQEFYLFMQQHWPMVGKSLKDWQTLSFTELKEKLQKHKVQLSLAEWADWMQLFNARKASYGQLESEAFALESSIDAEIYAIYELTSEEIRLIMNETGHD